MTLSKEEIRSFRAHLSDWFGRHKRDLPWRRSRDPYAIWVSEIMLQQTRVAAAVPFYERFLRRFPDFHALAIASESELLAHWAGLGYYYRARNLQKAAQSIASQGRFPSNHEDIRRLPGVGEYTSAAVASIAFGLPHAAVDGNVLRVLSRIFADSTDIASAAGRKQFAKLAATVLDRQQPGTFNQAMMELGATVCLPRNPQCLLCPVRPFCSAAQMGRQSEFPVKLSRSKRVEEERTVLWVEHGGRVLLWQRAPESRLMPGFWELPERTNLPEAVEGQFLGHFRHGITFHNYRFLVVEATVEENNPAGCYWVPLGTVDSLPTSTILRKARRLVERRRFANRPAISAAAVLG